jgi:UDP-N-acetylglucosamine transferase subunit ALG13
MILVTVGSMMPFDRLIRAMDGWAKNHPSCELLAQIGGGDYEPEHMRWTRMLSPGQFRETVLGASMIVAHGGMGSFFTALELRKRIVLLPRRAAYKEHTSDHQLHTVQWLRGKKGVFVAMSEDELEKAIDAAMSEENLPIDVVRPFAPESFLAKLRHFMTE